MNIKIIKFLNFLKNASLAHKNFIVVQNNSTLLKCVEALYKEGLILSYFVLDNSKENLLYIKLRNVNDFVLTSKIKFISKPSCIRYLPYHQICRLTLKKKVYFFFTDKGIFTLEECKQMRIGGVLSFCV